MDVMLQRHCARYIYVVPDGLRELMSDISREVLRSQPEDIYTFIADYLDALMITRENARVAAKFVEYLAEAAETIVDLLERTGMPREQIDEKVIIIQEAFRNWSAKKGILKEDDETVVARIILEAGLEHIQADAAAIVIQQAFRAYKIRRQREKDLLSGIIDWRVAAQSAIRLYRRTGVSIEEAKRAATLIKAAYKGYYTRRNLKRLNEFIAAVEEPEVMEEEMVEEYQADTFSMISSISGDKKQKEVRIDYTSVVPHVDFGEEIFIPQDENDELAEGEPKDDIMKKIFDPQFGRKDKLPTTASTESFIKRLLDTAVLNVIGPDEFSPEVIEEPQINVENVELLAAEITDETNIEGTTTIIAASKEVEEVIPPPTTVQVLGDDTKDENAETQHTMEDITKPVTESEATEPPPEVTEPVPEISEPIEVVPPVEGSQPNE